MPRSKHHRRRNPSKRPPPPEARSGRLHGCTFSRHFLHRQFVPGGFLGNPEQNKTILLFFFPLLFSGILLCEVLSGSSPACNGIVNDCFFSCTPQYTHGAERRLMAGFSAMETTEDDTRYTATHRVERETRTARMNQGTKILHRRKTCPVRRVSKPGDRKNVPPTLALRFAIISPG